jgi:hypothetical protein
MGEILKGVIITDNQSLHLFKCLNQVVRITDSYSSEQTDCLETKQ